MKRLHVALSGLLGCLAACNAAAATVQFTQPWYRVEIIVFERNGPAATNEALESFEPMRFALGNLAFPDDPARVYALDVETLAMPTLPAAAPDFEPPLPEVDEMPPRAEAQPLEEMQPVESGPLPAPIVVEPTPAERLAAQIAAYEAELAAGSLTWLPESSLTLRNERRRLGARAAYRVVFHGAFVQSIPPRDTPAPILIQTGDRLAARWSIEGSIAVTLARFLHVHARLSRQPLFDDPGTQILDEHRRMRSGELHYLDHPAFGLLVRVDPVTPPQALLDAAAALDPRR